VVFYFNEAQREAAQRGRELAQKRWSSPIVTDIVPASEFYLGEDYHQNYLDRNPHGYCNHRERY
jgi:peptide methionine sulfoxide reductase MsrA